MSQAIKYKGFVYKTANMESIADLGAWLTENEVKIQMGFTGGKHIVILSGRVTFNVGTHIRSRLTTIEGTGKDLPAAIIDAVGKWTAAQQSRDNKS